MKVDPAVSPMLLSECMCCDWCAFCGAQDQQGDIDAVPHAITCRWMNARVTIGMDLSDGPYRHAWAGE